MHRIDTATAVPALPAILGAGAKPNSYWQSGNPTTGAVPTVGDQDWFNEIQEEIMSVLADGGIAAVKGVITNLRDAIRNKIAAAGGAGQCYLSFSSNVALLLSPYGGNNLRIAGKNYAIPAAGLSFANAGVHVSGVPASDLAVSTDYLIFAMDDGAGNVIPDFWPVAGGHMTDTTPSNIGVEVRKNGAAPDPTRTLIGMCGTDAAGHFADADGNRLVLSWFNRHRKRSKTTYTANRSTGSTSWVEPSTEIRNACLFWADGWGGWHLTGEVELGGTTLSCAVGVGIDGALVPDSGFTVPGVMASGAGTSLAASGTITPGVLAEGRHFYSLIAATVTDSTVSFWGADLVGAGSDQARPWLILETEG